MTKTFFCLLAVLFCSYSFAQAPEMAWQKTFGGSSDDNAYCTQSTSDGGYILCGSTESADIDVASNHGDADVWVVKTSATGGLEWEKTFGGSDLDEATYIQQTKDGGYILCGYTFSTDGDVTGYHENEDIWILKITSTGLLEWQKTIGGTDVEEAYSIWQTDDDGYIVGGYSSSLDGDIFGNHGLGDALVVKLSATGGIEWQKLYGGSGDDGAEKIALTSDGGYILCGYTLSNDGDVSGNHNTDGHTDGWVVKLSSSGMLQWQRAYGGSGDDYLYSIEETPNGYYVAAGSSASTDGDVTTNKGYRDVWVIKLGSLGKIDWQNTFGGTVADEAYSVHSTIDGGYIVGAVSNSENGDVVGYHGYFDYWLIKLNSAGARLWERAFGGSSDDFLADALPTLGGGIIVSGSTTSSDGNVEQNSGGSDIWVLKLEASDPSILCPPVANTQLSSSLNGTSYQWQVNKGNGFENILNSDTYYDNENKSTLDLVAIPSSWAHYEYRCVVDGNYTDTITIKFVNTWTGGTSNNWENASNWGCGVIPDANTDVTINSGNIAINSNAICRSLTVKPGATVTVKPGYKLTVTH